MSGQRSTPVAGPLSVTPLYTAPGDMVVWWDGSEWNQLVGGGGSGTVTSITAAAPLTGGTITTSGTIGLGMVPTNLLGTGIASSTTYLRGDGTWAAAPSGGGNVTTGTLTTNALTIGTGATAIGSLAAGGSGLVLTSNGLGAAPSWQPAGTGSGTVGNGSVAQLAVYTGTNAVAGDGHLSETGSAALVNYNTTIGAMPTFNSPALLRVTAATGAQPHIASLAFGVGGAVSVASAVDSGGTAVALGSGAQLGGLGFMGYDGVAAMTASANLIGVSTEAFSSGHHGTRAELRTTLNGSAALNPVIGFEQDGGLTVPPSVTGGSRGAGTINVANGAYVDNVPLLSLSGGTMTGPLGLFGNSTATTQAVADSSANIATTAFVHNAVGASGGGNISGSLTAGQLTYGSGTNALSSFAGGAVGTVMHGAGTTTLPNWGAVNLGSDVTGSLGVGNLAGGSGASSTTFWCGNGTWATPTGGAANPGGSANQVQYNLAGTSFGGTSGLTVSNLAVTGMNMALTGDGTGDLYYRASGGALTRLGIGTTNQVLTVSGGLLPSWAAASSGVTSVTGTAPITASPTTGAVALSLTTVPINLGGTNAVTAPSALASLGAAPLAGATFTGKVVTLTSATGGAGFNLPAGTAPTAPANGDLWTTTAGLYAQINGSTVGPLAPGTVTSVGLLGPGGIFAVTGSPVTVTGTLGLTTTGTSGGIPYFSTTAALSSSAALTANALVLGGSPPTSMGLGTTTTVLHGNASGAPTFGAITGPEISSGAVTYTRMQTTAATQVLLGTGITGNAIGEITLGTNLSFVGNQLNATGAGGGVGAGVVNQLAVYNSTSSVAGDTHVSETGTQTFVNYNTTVGTMPAFNAPASLRVTAATGSLAHIAALGFGLAGTITAARAEDSSGTASAIVSGASMGAVDFMGYDGTTAMTASSNIVAVATQAFGVGAHGTRTEMRTTPNGQTTLAPVMGWESNGGITVPPSVTGGGIANAVNSSGGYYVNGAQIGGFSESVGWLAGANPNNAIIFTNNTGRTVTCLGIVGSTQVVETTGFTLDVWKVPSGTATITSGFKLNTTASFLGTETVGTPKAMLTAGTGTTTLAPGDRIAINVATGTPTLSVATITVYLQ